jgi:hypothetical protein
MTQPLALPSKYNWKLETHWRDAIMKKKVCGHPAILQHLFTVRPSKGSPDGCLRKWQDFYEVPHLVSLPVQGTSKLLRSL